jgi:hypothetical protein
MAMRIKVLSPNNLGDLALHLTYIEQMASGVAFWPENPIYAGGTLTYPIGVDLINSLLLLVGVDVLRGLIWVGSRLRLHRHCLVALGRWLRPRWISLQWRPLWLRFLRHR